MEKNMVSYVTLYTCEWLCFSYTVGQYMKQSDKIERQGTGVHYSNDGTEFSGVWVDDKMNGEGIVLFRV